MSDGHLSPLQRCWVLLDDLEDRVRREGLQVTADDLALAKRFLMEHDEEADAGRFPGGAMGASWGEGSVE